MQTTSASMAWLFLQENVQVQYLQKIALRAKNPFGPKWSHYLDMLYFPHVVRFSVAIEATIFRTRRLMLCSNQGKGPPFMGTALAAHKQSY